MKFKLSFLFCKGREMYLDKAVLWKKGAAFLFPFQNMMKAEQKVLKRFNKGCVDYHLLEDGDRILMP